MSDDGAHLGVNAKRALETVLGGEPQPSAEERMTVQEMEAWLRSATQAEATTYEGSARYCGKLVLEFLLAHPEQGQAPVENEYDWERWRADGQPNELASYLISEGLYERMKKAGVKLDALDLTGFMWGWAVNAARRCLELPPAPNPAIITV